MPLLRPKPLLVLSAQEQNHKHHNQLVKVGLNYLFLFLAIYTSFLLSSSFSFYPFLFFSVFPSLSEQPHNIWLSLAYQRTAGTGQARVSTPCSCFFSTTFRSDPPEPNVFCLFRILPQKPKVLFRQLPEDLYPSFSRSCTATANSKQRHQQSKNSSFPCNPSPFH